MYGYDERGNVDLLLRYTKSLIPLNQQYKAVQYRFDQLSGKVNEVLFQENKPDQYVHHYEYDAENRLVKSYSSTRLEAIHESSIDGLRPGLDANYNYYLHGPLARTELGEIKVQGIDYAYTMMGWLKTVNSDKLLPANDMGKDGYSGSFGATNYASDFPKDEMGFSLQYYDGDYQAIASSGGSGDIALQRAFVSSNAASTNIAYGSNAISPELFNGNISRMITSIAQFTSNGVPLVSAYKYDQLNRLASAEYYHMNASTAVLTSTQAWKNTFTYDANGNILSQKRNGAATQVNMDDLKYYYKAYDLSNANAQVVYNVNNQTGALENASGLAYASGQLELTNQLSYVTDNNTYTNNYTDDIDNQNNVLNYQYDEIGNLTKDMSEEIDKIEWTVYGKIKRITRTTTSNKPDLEFEYTPDGHRAVKIVIPKGSNMRTYTYYVRDAQGNIMATYSRNFQKTIDYANLTYAQVNTSLTNKTSAESFAWFMANAHSAGAPGFVAALKADILSSSANTDWFLNHSSFNPELVLNADGDLANRVWFNFDKQKLFEILINSGNLNLERICNCMKNRRLETGAPNYKTFIEHIFLNNKLRSSYLEYLSNTQPTLYYNLLSELGITPVDLNTDINNIETAIDTYGIAEFYVHYLVVSESQDCPEHLIGFQDYLASTWGNEIAEEFSSIEDFNEIFQNTSLDNFEFNCEEMGLPFLFSLLNSQNTGILRSTMINQVQGSGITTEQQKKTWLINWYFASDPMGSIYLATLRNSSIVASYQTSPGLLYGSTFTQSMENYFIKIKNHFGQSMFDQLVTEFAQQSNLYVDEIKVDEWHLYGSSRLGVYEANRLISKRVARDLNLDNQISTNEYVIETPEEVTYLFSSYQLERGAKRYELSNHLGNVLTVISDKKTAVFTGTTFNYFAAERISATDYSPFGAPLASRSWNGGEYRFGFNGKENDNDIKGNGTQQDYGMRIHDTRLGRFLSVDPLTNKFPMLSCYQFASNTPIQAIDLDGLEAVSVSLGVKAAVPIYTCIGVTGSAQIGLILDYQFNLVMYFTVSGGGSLGSGVSAGLAFTGYPSVKSYNDLMGFGGSVGFISPRNRYSIEGNVSFSDKNYYGLTLSMPNTGVSFGEAIYADVSYTNLFENYGKLTAGNWKSKVKEIAKTTGLSEDEISSVLQKMVKSMSIMVKDESKKSQQDKDPEQPPIQLDSKSSTKENSKSKVKVKEKKKTENESSKNTTKK